MPDTDTGPLGRPVIAGCAAWIPSGDNFGGIHRIDLATGAISNVSPIEVVWDLDQDGESLYAIGRPGNVVGDLPATLFRIDPATSEILGQLPIDLGAQTLRVVDNRAWVTGWRMGIKVYELPSGALLAEWPGEDVFAAELQFGDDAVWVRSGTDGGPVFVRIGRSTLERTEIPLPRDVTDAVVYYDVILGSTESGSIVRIDPLTGAVLSTTAIEGWVAGSLTSLVSTGMVGLGPAAAHRPGRRRVQDRFIGAPADRPREWPGHRPDRVRAHRDARPVVRRGRPVGLRGRQRGSTLPGALLGQPVRSNAGQHARRLRRPAIDHPIGTSLGCSRPSPLPEPSGSPRRRPR